MGWKLGEESSKQPEIFLARAAYTRMSICDALTGIMNTEGMKSFQKGVTKFNLECVQFEVSLEYLGEEI